MQSYRVETTISEQGTLLIKNVPFSAGEHVEVIVREMEGIAPGSAQYSLRGTPFKHNEPFAGVAEEDWETPR
ncbi:MAG: hypothetical protein ACWGMZ_07945 [Thermoguttaceae bacterium]